MMNTLLPFILLLLAFQSSFAWTNRAIIGIRSNPARGRDIFRLSEKQDATDEASIFPDDDCFDLCDIDWDLMPSHEDSDNENEDSSDNEKVSKDDDTDKHSPSFQRMRLEMQWGMRENEEDCDLEELETCSDFCMECVGRGFVQCRFCHGSSRIVLGDHVIPCNVCTDKGGQEVCKACQGTGCIASWTTLAENNATHS